MIIVDDAAIGADGHVDAGLLVVLVTGLCDLDDCGGLTTADALGLTGNADGTAANADLDEVCTGLCQETEALGIHNVACAHLHGVAVVLTDPGDGTALPLGVALGGVDAEHIHASLDQCGNALGIVAGVDAGTDHIALVGIQQLVDVLLMGIVVLAEHEVFQVALSIHQRQRVDLVVPDDVVAVVQGGILRCGDQLLDGSHKSGNGSIIGGVVDTVITGGHNAHKLAVRSAVGSNSDGGVAGAGLELQNIVQSGGGSQVGIGDHITGLIALDAAHHGSLVLNALGAVNEGHAALPCQCNGQLIAGDRLHDCTDHGDVHFQRAGLFPLAVLDQRGLQADCRGDILCRGIARNKQVLAKGAGRFFIEISHTLNSFFLNASTTGQHQNNSCLLLIN